MRILVACDSFKDALSSEEVCEAIAKGLRHAGPVDLKVEQMPLSDGGEGTLKVLAPQLSMGIVECTAMDPLFRPVNCQYGISVDGSTALIELAEASGLERLAISERNPLRTSSFGTGQLLADAKARGVRKIILAIGGSATTDAGIGAASALGWEFIAAGGPHIHPVGGNLGSITAILPPRSRLFAEVNVLCDVNNPLFGPQGAAFVYGAQKGGSVSEILQLDLGLRHIAQLVAEDLFREGLEFVPGAGAAGGLGFGALAFFDAELTPGIGSILEMLKFADAAARADLIITGEGHLDGQSGRGKLIHGICSKSRGKPVVALCGKVTLSDEEIAAIGLRAAFSINLVPQPLPQMLAQTAQNLERAAASLFHDAVLDNAIFP